MKHFSLKRKFSRILLTATCLAATVFISNDANAQSWNFAAPTDGAGTASTETGRSICSDAAGNIYVVGVFNNGGVGNTDFNIGAGVNNAPTSTSNDGYIASYDKNGVYRWHTIITGTGNEFSAPSGGICTNGTFVWAVGSTTVNGSPQTISSTATLSIVENSSPASSGSFTQAFVTKLSCGNGSVSWTATYGGPTSNNDNAQGVCVDPNGCCYVIGSYSGSFTMNSVTAPAIAGTSDLYVAKFGAGGNMMRIMTGGTTGAEMLGAGGGLCYVPGATPAIVAVGSISAGGNATFGSQTVTNTTTTANDGLLLEMDSMLGVSVAHVIGSAVAGQAEELLSAVYDPFSGGVYVCGYFGGNGVTFPGTPALTINTAGFQDGAVARYSTSANTFIWSRSINSTAGDRAWGIAADGQGGILVSGNYSAAPLAFSGSAVTIATHAGGVGDDVFTAHYNVAGTAVWALRAGGAGDDEARGIACYVETTPAYTQHVFTTGLFQETSTFGSTTLTADGTGNNDFFLARLVDLATPLSATQSQVNLTCNGVCTGSATVVASGGSAPYTYSWSPSGGSGATASSLCATNYTVTITDAASTSITKTFTITQPPAIVVTPVSQSNVSCFGGNNGAAQVIASGGTGVLTYNWTPGNPTGDGTGSVTGLTAQVYTVTVTDASSCTATRTFNITQPPALGTTGSQTNVSCFGGANGTATVTVTGGTPSYSYNWTPGNPPGDGTSVVTGLTAQVYTVTITDANGCQITRTFNITQPSAPVSGTTVVTNVSCFGGNNGAINLTPTGGTGPYTFNWLPSGPTTEDRTSLVAGTYTVQITDVNGCTGTVTASVTQPTSPVSGTTVVTNVSCFGGSNGAINLTPTGGTGPYTFNWLPSGPTTEDRTGLVAGTYSVMITDVNGCVGTVTALVTQPTTPVSGTTVVTNVACFGGNTGAINLTPTGGTGPYTFNWLPSGPTTEDRTGLVAGTYSVQITDVNGCVGTVTASVTQPTTPVSGTTVVTNVACFGGNTGAINLTPTGGTGPYTFNWLPSGPTTEDRTGLVAGTYTVQITDVNGCVGTVTASVTQPTSPVSGTTVVTNVSCFGGSNGAINLTPTGGTGPYTFNWLPSGPTTEDRTGLVAGTYSVQITDVNGCVGTVTASVTQPTTPVSGTTVVTNVSCFGGSNGAINLTPTGGTGPYTFNWLPSGPTTEDRTGLVAGTYSVQITDVNGCVGTVTASVTQPTTPVSGTTVVTNVACFGGNTGAINLTPTGGTGPYTFNWLPSGPTTEDRTGLVAGTYTVVITDVNGCTGTVTASVTQPTAPVSGTTVVTNVSCFGGSNGAINLTPTGGTGPYTFNWLPSGPTTEDRTGLVAGTYTVVITDVNGCTGTVTASVTQPTSPVSGTTVVTNVSCFGGSNGAINLTPTGGTGPYTFNWLPSGPTTEDRTGLVAGTYTVVITDVNGCTGTVTASVTQPTSPVSGTTVVTNVSCFGGSNGAINLTPTGGTGPYTFNWLPSGPTTEDRTGLSAGTYSVQITDMNGCTATVTATVTQPTSPVSGTTVVTNVSCFGGSNGAINLTPTGGTGPYTFNWLPSGPTTEDRTGLTAGTYSVQITDVNGCTATVTVTVTAPPALVITSTQTNISCNGGCNGSATVVVSGGTPGYSYSWSPSGGNSATATGLCVGTYTVIVTDANGCTATRTISITQPAAIVVTPASQTNVSCFGGNNGTASVIVTGGTGAYSYSWAPTGGTASTATGLIAGSYTVTVTDANLCVSTATFLITEPPALTFTTMQTNVSCNGGSNGDAMVMVSGGTGPYTYMWSPSGGTADLETGLTAGGYTVTITDANFCTTTATFLIAEPTAITYSSMQTNVSCNGGSDGSAMVMASGGTGALTYSWAPTGGTNATATGLAAGTYTVTITDANSCSVTASFNITEPTPIVVTTTQSNVSCFGTCDGSATVAVSGGTPGYTYLWMPSSMTTATVTALCAGTYTVIVTDANGCTATVTVTITEPTPMVITATQTNVSCFGACDGSASVVVAGGTGPYTYNWLPTGGNSASATGLCAGTYTLAVTDANGCTMTQIITITEPAVLVAGTMQNDPTCVGANTGDAMVMPSGGTGPYTYLWAPTGGIGQSEFNLTAGSYTSTVTDANGCTATATFLLVDPTPITFTSSQTNVTCNGGNDGTATVTASGGTGTLTYLWAPSGGTNATETILSAGSYTVTITDANLCTTTATFLITEPGVLTASVDSTTNPSVCGATDGAIYITVTGGTAAYTFVWDNSFVTEDITGITAGSYNVIVTDANGCTTTASASINDPGAPTVTLSLPVDTACGDFPGTINLSGESPAGGTFSGTAVVGNTFDPFTAGMGMHYITYSFTDINGCTGSTTDSIFVNNCSGIQAIGTTTQWNLFPNPTNGLLTIASPQHVNGNVLIDVLGTDGKLIMSETKSDTKNMMIDLSTMPVGVYFIRITGNENVSVYRIVKM
jgi:GH43 family beta-xylosidase